MAIVLANNILDRINADPDDDLAILSRQLLRLLERTAELESRCTAQQQRIDRLEAVCKEVDAVMDTAAMLGVNSILSPAYAESWAAAHINLRNSLNQLDKDAT